MVSHYLNNRNITNIVLSTLLRGRRGQKHKIVQIAVFPIIFVSDCNYDFCIDYEILNVWLRKSN